MLCHSPWEKVFLLIANALLYLNYTDRYDPPAPSNGTVNLTVTGVTTYKATAKLYCSIGYSRNGNDTMMCKADGMWSLNAECTINGLFIILHLLIWLHYLRYGTLLQEGIL